MDQLNILGSKGLSLAVGCGGAAGGSLVTYECARPRTIGDKLFVDRVSLLDPKADGLEWGKLAYEYMAHRDDQEGGVYSENFIDRNRTSSAWEVTELLKKRCSEVVNVLWDFELSENNHFRETYSLKPSVKSDFENAKRWCRKLQNLSSAARAAGIKLLHNEKAYSLNTDQYQWKKNVRKLIEDESKDKSLTKMKEELLGGHGYEWLRDSKDENKIMDAMKDRCHALKGISTYEKKSPVSWDLLIKYCAKELPTSILSSLYK